MRLTRQQRNNVNAVISLIKALHADDAKSFYEIAKAFDYKLYLKDEDTKDLTVQEVMDSLNETQRKVVAYLINEAVDEESRRHDGGRWNY